MNGAGAEAAVALAVIFGIAFAWLFLRHSRLAVAEARLRTIMETVPVGLLMAELPSGRVIGANAAAETLLRHPIRDAPGLGETPDATGENGQPIAAQAFPLARLAAGTEAAPSLEMRYRRGDGTRAWLRMLARPVAAPRGKARAGVLAILDIDLERRALDALADSEALFHGFAEQSPDVVYVIDIATRRLVYLSPAYEQIWGESRDIVLNRPERWEELVHPDDREATLAIERGYWTARAPIRFEYRIVRPDGSVRHIRDTAVPVPDNQGRMQRIVGIAHDATERRLAEARLRASEERLSLASAAAHLGVFDVDAVTGLGTVSAELRALYGLPSGDGSLPREEWLSLIHPEDRARMGETVASMRAPGLAYRAEFRIHRADTGALRWIASRGSVLAVSPGATPRFVGVSYDITDRREAEERQALLAREVDHRARNVLAVVQSILRLTRAEDPRRYVQAVEGRVAALARAHTLLSRDRWTGASLHDLVREELIAYRGGGRVTLSGPPVRLRPEAVQPLSMVLHELATNAAKYGALSVPAGRLEVQWSLPTPETPLDEARLTLLWTERDGPPIAEPPSRQGFGSLLIAATLRDQLQGGAAFDWRPEGLSCRIALPPDLVLPPDATPPEPAPPAPAPVPPTSLDGWRVLLVEDEPLIRLLMETTLGRLGCIVVGPASSLAEAWHFAGADEVPPDAAVLDMNLHGEACDPLAHALAARGVKLVFVTGYGDVPRALSRLGPVLRKPLEDGALAAALRTVLGGA